VENCGLRNWEAGWRRNITRRRGERGEKGRSWTADGAEGRGSGEEMRGGRGGNRMAGEGKI